jgi:hypothetical protein
MTHVACTDFASPTTTDLGRAPADIRDDSFIWRSVPESSGFFRHYLVMEVFFKKVLNNRHGNCNGERKRNV